MTQTTSHILMVRPASFGYNEQTAVSNAFQNNIPEDENAKAQQAALDEFNNFVKILQRNGVNVTIAFDTEEPRKPDAIFPNNWITTHHNGAIVLYPMCAVNRRYERSRGIIDLIKTNFDITKEIDYSSYEAEDKFLEGTGSMIFDRIYKIAYACLSVRTDRELFEKFCQDFGYTPVAFTSVDEDNKEIYHTNVMMSVARHYVVICMESIKSKTEKEKLLKVFKKTGKEVIDISYQQVNQFAGNVIELNSNKGESLLVMSERAYKSFTVEQVSVITKYSKIVYAPLYTIEKIGGGSARCMIAEIFLPQKQLKTAEKVK